MKIKIINEAQYKETAKMIERSIKHSQFSNYYPKSEIEKVIKCLDENGIKQKASWTHFYVLIEDFKIIACGAIGKYYNSNVDSSLFSIFVDPDYQNKGYGRKIIETLEKDELFIKAKRIEVQASISAIPFYRKMGYEYKNGKMIFSDGHFSLEKFNN